MTMMMTYRKRRDKIKQTSADVPDRQGEWVPYFVFKLHMDLVLTLSAAAGKYGNARSLSKRARFPSVIFPEFLEADWITLVSRGT